MPSYHGVAVAQEVAYEKMLACLESEHRAEFFALLVQALSISARAGYVAAGNDETTSAHYLTGMNEILHVVANQLLAEAGVGDGYGDDETFLDVLMSRATQFDRAGDVYWSIEWATSRDRPA
jgi:hypothetical protein